MLADDPSNPAQIGTLNKDVQMPSTFRFQLIGFISNELPRWRDDPQRPTANSETELTSQLCGHLNSASRHAAGWDMLQFRVEEVDEENKGRKIDLIPSPSGVTILIEGRRHTHYDSLMPIECKRLPTPPGQKRDEREYVINAHSSTGGIHRFKAGLHGSIHNVGAMIAYVQQKTNAHWNNVVASWICELISASEPGWTADDLLSVEHQDRASRLTVLHSSHERPSGLPVIALRHLWIEM